MSKCPRCQGTSFSCAPGTASDYNFELNFIQCSQCNTVVGVLTKYDAGVIAHKLEEDIKNLKKVVDRIANSIR